MLFVNNLRVLQKIEVDVEVEEVGPALGWRTAQLHPLQRVENSASSLREAITSLLSKIARLPLQELNFQLLQKSNGKQEKRLI